MHKPMLEVGDTTVASDMERRLRELERECADLRRENAYLRSRLGTPAPEPPVAVPVMSPTVDGKSPAKEKIALFRSLFRGREDVFAKRWESRSGKVGYSPGIPAHQTAPVRC